jgi:hypothetical protein
MANLINKQGSARPSIDIFHFLVESRHIGCFTFKLFDQGVQTISN